MHEMEAAQQSEFKNLRQDIARLDTRLVEFRAELKHEIAGVRSELKQDLAAVRSELKQDIAGLGVKVAGVQSELIKWTFVFWLGTIGIVMLLLRYFSDPG
ncbi:MAG TPA: hypothetical protein VNL18_14340 [Gemmatimonadales bacterium]|nr:hypothetical protein [Gemmatimonadales bacterium]